MNIKKTMIIVLIIFSLSSCMAKKNSESYYEIAKKNLMSNQSIFMKIIDGEQSEEFDNKKIIIFGNINKNESRIYPSPEFEDPLNLDDEYYKRYWSILLYKDYQNRDHLKLDHCRAGNTITELHGIFHIERSLNGEPNSYYITDIEKIYEFKVVPNNHEGEGERYECYPDLKK